MGHGSKHSPHKKCAKRGEEHGLLELKASQVPVWSLQGRERLEAEQSTQALRVVSKIPYLSKKQCPATESTLDNVVSYLI